MKKKSMTTIILMVIFLSYLFFFFPVMVFPQDSPGDVYLYPTDTHVWETEDFSTFIMINSGTHKPTFYNFTVSYDPAIIQLTDIREGADGFVAASGSQPTPGDAEIWGFDAVGTGPGEELHFLTIKWVAKRPGTTSVNITINTLADENDHDFNPCQGIGGSVTVNAITPGDVNIDSFIDIVDALLIAQFYVGAYPEGFVEVNGDVNHDNTADIVDALLVARYYVGLEDILPVSTPAPTTSPENTSTPVPTFEANVSLVGSIKSGVGVRDDWRESLIAGDFLYILSNKEMKVFDISSPAAPEFIQDKRFLSAYYYIPVAYENYIYAYYRYSSSTVYIYDISEPQNPLRVNSIFLHDYTRGMLFSGTYAFVAHESYLSTVDLSDPLHPENVSDFNCGGTIQTIKKRGEYIYVCSWNETAGLQIIDISDPLAPVRIGSLIVNMLDFTISDDYLYGVSEDILYIINISDPGVPTIVGELARDFRTETIYAAGNYVYLSYHPGDPMTRLDCINAVNPAQPFVQSTMTLPYWNYSLAVKDHYLYYTCNTTTSHACCVYILDIAQPGNPVYAGLIDGGGFTHSMTVKNKILYMADGFGGMKIVDVSDPAQPINLSRVSMEDTLRIAVSGDYAYCASGKNGMSTIDISDPAQPVLCSTIPTYDSAVDVETDGSYVYVGDQPWGLTIIDPSQPEDPQIVYHALPDGYPTPVGELLPTPKPHANAWNTRMLSLSGNTACLSVQLEPCIRIVDISDPHAPVQTGFIPLNIPGDLAVTGNHLYLPGLSGIPLLVYDIAEPGNPVEIGACPAIDNFYCNKIALSNNYAFLASTNQTSIIEISDPVNPVYRGTIPHGADYYPIEDIIESDGYLYVASGANGDCVFIYKIE
ncbi:MAG: hypothetical protein JXJ04_08645 [Spirochaetales bacterium]|nr:hypothetical protein [Spirochaetales bacterium]